DDCGEGRYCERKTAECKALDGPRAITQPGRSAEPAPERAPESTPTAAPSASAPAKK
ncbi:MAG: sugar hydrolase, partial [Polyangiaceae bacterium]|nr:sugar hydrolase [Polyangiaceae bacterium]